MIEKLSDYTKITTETDTYETVSLNDIIDKINEIIDIVNKNEIVDSINKTKEGA